jgi:fumarate hydratase class II
MANDRVVGTGGASGYFKINACKPLVIFNSAQSATMVTNGSVNFSSRALANSGGRIQATRPPRER